MSEALALPAPKRQKKQPERHELAYRETDKLRVILYWYRKSNTVAVEMQDDNDGLQQSFLVPPDKALDAFNHPYVYAPDKAA